MTGEQFWNKVTAKKCFFSLLGIFLGEALLPLEDIAVTDMNKNLADLPQTLLPLTKPSEHGKRSWLLSFKLTLLVGEDNFWQLYRTRSLSLLWQQDYLVEFTQSIFFNLMCYIVNRRHTKNRSAKRKISSKSALKTLSRHSLTPQNVERLKLDYRKSTTCEWLIDVTWAFPPFAVSSGNRSNTYLPNIKQWFSEQYFRKS